MYSFGPTGVGEYACQTCEFWMYPLPLPTPTLTEAGCGEDVENILLRLIQTADPI